MLWTPVGGTTPQRRDARLGRRHHLGAFLGGGLYGTVVYFVGGLVLYAPDADRRRDHVPPGPAPARLCLGAARPFALPVLPVRLAVYGEDVFSSGGSDHGAGNTIFFVVELAFVAWALALLAVGLRTLVRAARPRSGQLLVRDRVGVPLLGEAALAHVGDVRLERALASSARSA